MSDERLRDGEHWARTVEKRLYLLEQGRTGTTDTGWQPLSALGYQNGWAQHSDTWRPYYRKRGNEVVMRGLIRNVNATSSGSLIVVMPVGLRPVVVNNQITNGHHFAATCGQYDGQYIRAFSNGTLDVGKAEEAGVWVSLDTVRYLTD